MPKWTLEKGTNQYSITKVLCGSDYSVLKTKKRNQHKKMRSYEIIS